MNDRRKDLAEPVRQEDRVESFRLVQIFYVNSVSTGSIDMCTLIHPSTFIFFCSPKPPLVSDVTGGARRWRFNSNGQLVDSESESAEWDLADEIVRLKIGEVDSIASTLPDPSAFYFKQDVAMMIERRKRCAVCTAWFSAYQLTVDEVWVNLVHPGIWRAPIMNPDV
ncbi:hypothetical protein B0H14DRAFT_2627991 [Mycena olivaceomarginata]|nr:hypothetical protein B0H14DRAFT_2627991 [Mycena olivaceomarginata]